MYTKVDSTMTIGDLIAGKDYRVVVYLPKRISQKQQKTKSEAS